MSSHNFLPGVEQRQCKQPAQYRAVHQAGEARAWLCTVGDGCGAQGSCSSDVARAIAGSTTRRLHLLYSMPWLPGSEQSSPKGNSLMRNHEADLQVEQQMVSWTANVGCMAELVLGLQALDWLGCFCANLQPWRDMHHGHARSAAIHISSLEPSCSLAWCSTSSRCTAVGAGRIPPGSYLKIEMGST